MSNKDSLYFTFDGIDSETFEIMQVSTSTGLLEEQFLPTRTLVESRVYGRDKSFLHGYSYEPKKFSISFYIEDYDDQEKINQISRWLLQPDYKQLYFSNNPHRIFYVMAIGEISISHNSINQGIVNIDFQCNSPYSYSPSYNVTEYLTNNNDGQIIEIENKGIKTVHLDLEIVKVGLGDIEVVNYTNSLQFKLVNNLDGEIIAIDAENEDIETSLPNTYRFNDFSGNYMELAVGTNRLRVIGDGEFNFKHYNILP